MRRSLACLLSLASLLAACQPSPRESSAASRDGSAPAGEGAPALATGWQVAPSEGVQSSTRGDTLTLVTGPHAVAWPTDGTMLTPPYSVEATLHKLSGGLHEGYGLVFGGDPLEGPESAQHYSYFLVRGDGSYLVKRREGAQTPTVRDWTAHPAIRRDDGASAAPHRLRVQVDSAEAVFFVNGQEVARVPAGELRLQGRAGVRVSHNLRLEVAGFTAAASPRSAP